MPLATGHTLTTGDVGRTELAGDVEAAASALYDRLFGKPLLLGDRLEVLPGPFSGSACGRELGGRPSSTLGFERAYNLGPRPRSLVEFVAFMKENIPPKAAACAVQELPPPQSGSTGRSNGGRARSIAFVTAWSYRLRGRAGRARI